MTEPLTLRLPGGEMEISRQRRNREFCGQLPYGGRYQRAEEVFQNVFARIAADVENFSARPNEILPAGDDRILALGRYAGTGRAGAVDVAFAHLWTVPARKIVKFVQYANTHIFREAVGIWP